MGAGSEGCFVLPWWVHRNKAKQNKINISYKFGFSLISQFLGWAPQHGLQVLGISRIEWCAKEHATEALRKLSVLLEKRVSHIQQNISSGEESFFQGKAWLDPWIRHSPKSERSFNFLGGSTRHASKTIKTQYRSVGEWLSVKKLWERQLYLSSTWRKAILKTTSQRECTFYRCSQIATLPSWPLFDLETICLWEFECMGFPLSNTTGTPAVWEDRPAGDKEERNWCVIPGLAWLCLLNTCFFSPQQVLWSAYNL